MHPYVQFKIPKKKNQFQKKKNVTFLLANVIRNVLNIF